jgi:tetratricopeptide (TPR) repeat protein
MDGQHWTSYGGGLGISAAVEVDSANGYEVIVLANSDQLVAERISGRIYSYIQTSEYVPATQLEKNFTFEYYQTKGKQTFFRHFKADYQDKGYTQFIGRTINELGMALLKNKSWEEAFDMFEYLVVLFPDAPQVNDSLAYAYYSKGDKDQAKQTFGRSLSINSQFKSDYVSDNYGHSNRLK